MIARHKQLTFGGGDRPFRPGPSWLAGLVIGMAVSNLAAGAMLLGTGTAIGKAMVDKAFPGAPTKPD